MPQCHAEIILVPQHRHLVDARHGLFKQLKTLGAQCRRVVRYAGHTASWPRQTSNEAGCDWITGANDNDRGNVGTFHRSGRRPADDDDGIDLACGNVPCPAAAADQFACWRHTPEFPGSDRVCSRAPPAPL